MTDQKEDKRPEPKPRKNAALWQTYLMFHELVELRKKHNLRIDAAEKGKSNFDAVAEQNFISTTNLDFLIDGGRNPETGEKFPGYRKAIADLASIVSIWPWLSSIKGLGDSGLSAQLVAQIDDISKFANVSKLWRFAGYAVINGKAERYKRGEVGHFNKLLKGICTNIGQQFIWHQTMPYVLIYYDEKKRLRERFPDPIKGEDGKIKYTDGHIDNMARRKMMKIFLQHLWLKWREAEGLPTSKAYVEAILGHSDIILPD